MENNKTIIELKAVMKEACKPYAHETKKLINSYEKAHKKQRSRLISQLGKLIITLSIIALLGCGSSQGWRVSFGVAPVTALDDSQQLNQEQEK